MKKIVLIYGLMASILIIGTSSFLLWMAQSHSSEWLGYLIMIVGFSFTFIAIKQHRDKNLGGIINFSKAFQVGMLVTLIACFFYVVSWEVYYNNVGSNFIQAYQDTYIESLRSKGTPEVEVNAAIKEMSGFAKQYENFFFRVAITLIEILPVGIIITIISALLLRTKKRRKI
ncbi:MAG: DUF4199 domain-containing protein [Marinicellaceae bacterium]